MSGRPQVRVLLVDDDPASAQALDAYRRAGGAVSESVGALHFGPIVLHRDSGVVEFEGRTARLGGKECAVLELLMLRQGSLVSRDAFLSHLYRGMGIDEPEMKIIDVFICHLRRKLAQVGIFNLIETASGRGYMIRKPPVAPAPAAPAPAAPAPVIAGRVA